MSEDSEVTSDMQERLYKERGTENSSKSYYTPCYGPICSSGSSFSNGGNTGKVGNSSSRSSIDADKILQSTDINYSSRGVYPHNNLITGNNSKSKTSSTGSNKKSETKKTVSKNNKPKNNTDKKESITDYNHVYKGTPIGELQEYWQTEGAIQAAYYGKNDGSQVLSEETQKSIMQDGIFNTMANGKFRCYTQSSKDGRKWQNHIPTGRTSSNGKFFRSSYKGSSSNN